MQKSALSSPSRRQLHSNKHTNEGPQFVLFLAIMQNSRSPSDTLGLVTSSYENTIKYQVTILISYTYASKRIYIPSISQFGKFIINLWLCPSTIKFQLYTLDQELTWHEELFLSPKYWYIKLLLEDKIYPVLREIIY